jgi:hypothetical protein
MQAATRQKVMPKLTPGMKVKITQQLAARDYSWSRNRPAVGTPTAKTTNSGSTA